MQPSAAGKRLVLTSVNQLITLVRGNPQLAQEIPKFGTFTQMGLSVTPKKSCNCGGAANFTTPDAGKQTAESVLSSLTSADFLKVKSVLDLSELCYYKRSEDQNKLEMICV
jgi:hypothetical protein